MVGQDANGCDNAVQKAAFLQERGREVVPRALSTSHFLSRLPRCGWMTQSEVEQKLLTVAQHLLVSRRWPARAALQLKGTTCASLSLTKRKEARFSLHGARLEKEVTRERAKGRCGLAREC